MFCSPMPRSCRHHSGSTIYRRFVYSVKHFRPTACNNKLPPCKGIQNSLGFQIPRHGFGIPVTGLQSLSTELLFQFPIVSGIPISLSCIPDSKAQDSGFHKKKFSLITESGFPQYIGRNEKNIYIIIRFYIFCFAVKPYFGLQLSIASFFCQVAITFYQSGTEDRLRTILQPKQSGNKKCLVF